MKRHAQRLVVLVLAQAACLGVGLWLEHRFVLAADASEPTAPAAKDSAAGIAAVDAPDNSAKGRAAPRETRVAAVRAIAFVWIAALQAVVAFLVLSQAQEAASRTQAAAETVSLHRHNDLLRTRDAVIFGLAKLVESRDPDTGSHLERIATYSTRLASVSAAIRRYRRQITKRFVQLIGISSSLHDIGKVGIGDAVLMKPGRFEDRRTAPDATARGVGRQVPEGHRVAIGWIELSANGAGDSDAPSRTMGRHGLS